jgi:hypothetical protein
VLPALDTDPEAGIAPRVIGQADFRSVVRAASVDILQRMVCPNNITT